MKNLTCILSLIVLISFLASCAAPSETPDTGTHDTRTPGTVALDTVTPSPIPTETLMATITPELAQPALGHNLSAENAKTMVVEGGTWVVKNADGLITASWDSAKSEWVYNMENIHKQIFVVENYTQFDPASIPAEMLSPLADYTSGRLTDETGNPVVDGTIIEKIIVLSSVRIGNYDAQYAYVASRFRGLTQIIWAAKGAKHDGYIALFEVCLAPDKSIYLSYYLSDDSESALNLFLLSDGSIAKFEPNGMDPNAVPPWGIKENDLILRLKNASAVGMPVLFPIEHDMPEGLSQAHQNKDRAELLSAIRNHRLPTGALPSIEFTTTDFAVPADFYPH